MTRCQFSGKNRFSVSALTVFMIVLFGGSAAYAAAAPATTSEPTHISIFSQSKYWNPVISFTGGESYSSNVGASAYFPSPDPTQDMYYSYSATKSRQSNGLLGFFLGTEIMLPHEMRLQVGVNYAQPSAFSAKGILTQGPAIIGSGLPDTGASSQYNYSYNIISHQILAQTKLLFDVHQIFHPYAGLGLGMSANNTYNFQSGVTPANTELSNNFRSHTSTSFSYSLGLGMDVDLNQYMRFGVGYRFTDYGSAKTGSSAIDTGGTNSNGVYNPPLGSSNQLSQSHLYANEILAQLSFLVK